MTAVEKAKEYKVYDKIMNVIDDFIKHGERTDLSSETRCVAYINKGKFTRWLKQNFVIRELASLEAEKPVEDAPCVLCECEFYDSKYPQNCSGECGGEPEIAQCTKYANNSRILQQYAETYHAKKCDECNDKNFARCDKRSDITTDVDS